MDSVYERQKKPVASSVGGFADPTKVCSKCGQEFSELRECVHCGWNVNLCTGCFFGKEHWEDYQKSYGGLNDTV